MKKFVLVLLTLGLAACSQYASNGEKIYLQSKNGASINVPSPLTASNIGHFYDLPTPGPNFNIGIAPPSTAPTT
ncbi:hypothetical protein ACQUW5_13725 [Legionella sp. CNM-1927-20]|uniref:hypothetical protein n=1 Tax=Legionella sp. CNM-1927-20 TaxID=3422221 RepID=UPI00403AC1B5